MGTDVKITVYLAVSNDQKRNELEMAFMTQYLDISVFSIPDLNEYQQRLKLSPPHLVISDAEFVSKVPILKEGITRQELAMTSYIVWGSLPDKEDFLDEMMVGKFQFFDQSPGEDEWKVAVAKSFKFSFESGNSSYTHKQVKMGDVLMQVGDPADKIYILKKGKLQAFHLNDQGQKVILGEVLPGEFVGEMAYFNSEPRSASVIALENSELVEIPLKSFDRVIYQKPAWAMKLIETLSRRLKKYISK